MSKGTVNSFCAANIDSYVWADDIIIHRDLFWPIVEALVLFLELFAVVTEELSKDSEITAHLLFAHYVALRLHCSSPTTFEKMSKELKDRPKSIITQCTREVDAWLVKKFEPFRNVEIMAFALNPNFRLLPNAPENEL
jgi:hypothetical protein